MPAAVNAKVPNADFVSAAEPGNENAEAFCELAPQSVRLLVWRKRASLTPSK